MAVGLAVSWHILPHGWWTAQALVLLAVCGALGQLRRDALTRATLLLAIAGLAAWWYRGGPWEPLSRHMFA